MQPDVVTKKAEMRFGSGISNDEDVRTALAEAAAQAAEGLAGEAPDLAIFFVTPHHVEAEQPLGTLVRERTGARLILGVTAAAVIGGGRESERVPGVSLFLARMPGVDVRPFWLPPQERGPRPDAIWSDAVPLKPGEPGAILTLADPFTVHIAALLEFSNERWPGTPVVGGFASGAEMPGGNRLWIDDEVTSGGAAGVVLAGPISVRTIVSQGCRPIGRHLVITKADGNIIHEIGGKPALVALKDVIGHLTRKEQHLAKRSLHVGRVIDEKRDSFGRGDFLVRNPIGIDPNTGALAIADLVRAGQTIQLHVRDAETASEDLKTLLEGARAAGGERSAAPVAALVFTCSGRGVDMFGAESHETGLMRAALGEVPIAGFFCAGEFGPIGGKNFLHSFTSSIVILSAPADAAR